MTDQVGRAAIAEIDTRIDTAQWQDLLEGQDIDELVRTSIDAAIAVLREEASSGAVANLEDTAEISLVLTDDAAIAELNSTWRGRDGATNVLSFPQDDDTPPPGAPRLLGDIVLAAETVHREAAKERKFVADHTRHLLIHGFLHLLGYDHGTTAEAAEMEALETAALARLGIADPYLEPELEADSGP